MSAQPVAEAPVFPLRLLPAPPCQPPFDDEAAARPSLLPGQLEIVGDPAERCLPAADRDLLADVDGELVPEPTARCLLPDPRAWALRFAQAMAEVLAATRPARQLFRWTSWPLYLQLERMVAEPAARLATSPPGKPLRPVLRSIRVSEPCPGVAEACAVVRVGGRFRALALRFEGLDGRWLCTALQVG